MSNIAQSWTGPLLFRLNVKGISNVEDAFTLFLCTVLSATIVLPH